MSKKICVIGTGYVGLIASVGLSDFGNEIIGVNIDGKKLKCLMTEFHQFMNLVLNDI